MKKPHSRGSTNNKGGTYREGAKDQLTFEDGMYGWFDKSTIFFFEIMP